jgi:hypothetical protein
MGGIIAYLNVALLNIVFALFLNMVFNVSYMNTQIQIQADKESIEQHGGPTKLAEMLGYDKQKGGVQRVHNWMTRGIPPRVKLDWPELFQHKNPPRKPTKPRAAPP